MTDQTPDAAACLAGQLNDKIDEYRKPTVQVDIAPHVTDVMLAAAVKRTAETLGFIAPMAEQLAAPTAEHYPAITPDGFGQHDLWAHRVGGPRRRMDLVGIEPVLYWHPVPGRGPGAFVAVVGLDDEVWARGAALYVGPHELAGLRVVRHDRDRRVAVVSHDGIEGATEFDPAGYIADAAPLDETMPTSDDARAAARAFARRAQDELDQLEAAD